MKTPLVSIIVPIYNVEDYLKKCIDSIISQSYMNTEIILVDDGSTDGSGKIADEYAKTEKNIRVIHKINGGLSSARNAGIKKAKGEWISFIDSDDYVDKKFIESLLSIATKSSADIASCSFKSFSSKKAILKKSIVWPSTLLSGDEAIDDMILSKRPAYIWLSIYKSNSFKENKIQFPEGKNYEDIATRIKLLTNAKKVAYTNEQLYFYRIREESITGKPFTLKDHLDYEFAIKDAERFLKRHKKATPLKNISYFKYYSAQIQLNHIAKSGAAEKNLWKKIRKELKEKYSKTVFPTKKIKLISKLQLLLSQNKQLYTYIYRKAKK